MPRLRRALRVAVRLAAVAALVLAGAYAVHVARSDDDAEEAGDGSDEQTAATAGPSEPAGSTAPPSAAATAVPPVGDAVQVGTVHDGDSFVARPAGGGGEVDVRMIGVNAPELGECRYAEARAALRELLAAGPVRLERDVTDRDRYRRLLRHVRTPDDELAGEVLVARGLALAIPSDPDVAHAPELRAAQATARTARAGLWDPSACGPPASTALTIEAVTADPPGRDQFDLNGEQVVVANGGATPVAMTGWKLRDDSTRNRYWFPDGFTLPAGGRVTVHVGSGTDTPADLYWGRRYPILDNAGDTALLLDPHGNVVAYRDVP